MKKLLSFLAILLSVNFAYASFVPTKTEALPGKAEQVQQERLLMEKVTLMSAKDYGAFRGKKLSVSEKITFKLIKHTLKRKFAEEETSGFNFGGFLLGLVLGPIGLLGALIFSSDKNFRRWARLGMSIWLAAVGIALAAGGY